MVDRGAKRLFDVLAAATLLVLLALPIAIVVILVRLDSPGPGFYRCRRVGHRGLTFAMLKFRKMHDGARGPALTVAGDKRFTRLGRFLGRSKLDELPQLWNVLKGDMSFVGPRPEDPSFVVGNADAYREILEVRPGITGLSQLAFAREAEILNPNDRLGHYLTGILPQKIQMDRLYAERRSFAMDLRVLGWTALTVIFGSRVAVHRSDGALNKRRRPEPSLQVVELPTRELEGVPPS